MFSQVFVCPGAEGWLPSMHHRCHDQHRGGMVGFPAYITGHMTSIQGAGLPTGGSASRGICPQGGLPTGGLGRLPYPRTRKADGTHPIGMLSCFCSRHLFQSQRYFKWSISINHLKSFSVKVISHLKDVSAWRTIFVTLQVSLNC